MKSHLHLPEALPLARLAALAALIAWIPVSIAAPPAKQTLAGGFSTCEFADGSLASDLMLTVVDLTQQKSFASKYSAEAKGLTLSPDKKVPDYVTAHVDLVQDGPIAGQTPLSLSATTCQSGCGLATWVLEFGELSRGARASLRNWVRFAPGRPWDIGRSTLKPELFERRDKTVALVCDPSS